MCDLCHFLHASSPPLQAEDETGKTTLAWSSNIGPVSMAKIFFASFDGLDKPDTRGRATAKSNNCREEDALNTGPVYAVSDCPVSVIDEYPLMLSMSGPLT